MRKCQQSFNAKAKLRIHIEKNHTPPLKFKCESCEQRFATQNQRTEHMKQCHEGFETINTPVCRYFANGFCSKGDSCSFLPQTQFTAPLCRNCPRCGYLFNGVCNFFHPGIGVQSPRFQNQTAFPSTNNQRNITQGKVSPHSHQPNRCCRNCPFIHHEQDFPPLSKNNPQENMRKQRNVNIGSK